MKGSLNRVYSWALSTSRLCVLLALILLALMQILRVDLSISAQMVIALVALLIGVPHGAIDHLIAIPSRPRLLFIAYIAIYIAVALIAGWVISNWELLGFQIVVMMSALHFGFGDASFHNETREASGSRRYSLMTSLCYAIPAGLLPLILPLTDKRTMSSLERINPSLIDWAGSDQQILRIAVLVFSGILLFLLSLKRKFDLVVDLLLLLIFSLVAPPLISFAIYFGLWHALRHTARLVPKLPSARAHAMRAHWKVAIVKVIAPGLYAVVLTVGVAIFLGFRFPDYFSSSVLWSSLVVVWSLTVPHMMTTAKFDLRALR